MTIGSNYAVFRFRQYMINTVQELKLSSYCGSLCDHEKASLEILIGENGRERAQLFPTHIPLKSDHYRCHIPDQIKGPTGDLIASERGTERKNQHLLSIQRSISKKVPDLEKRARTEFFQRDGTEFQLFRPELDPRPVGSFFFFLFHVLFCFCKSPVVFFFRPPAWNHGR